MSKKMNRKVSKMLEIKLTECLNGNGINEISAGVSKTALEGKYISIAIDYASPPNISDKVNPEYQSTIINPDDNSKLPFKVHQNECKRPEIIFFTNQNFNLIKEQLAQLGVRDIKLNEVCLTSPLPPIELVRRIEGSDYLREATKEEIDRGLDCGDIMVENMTRQSIAARQYFKFVPNQIFSDEAWELIRYSSIRLFVNGFWPTTKYEKLLNMERELD